jgi:DNA-binding PadR family transcriptional regulator
MSNIRFAILGALTRQALSGYDLKKQFAENDILHWSGNNNQIYTALLDLLREGAVTVAVEADTAGPARKVYSLSERGQAELRAWLQSPPELPQIRHPLLVQLAWADQLAPAELDGLLAAYEDEVAAQLQTLKAKARTGDRDPSGAPRAGYIQPALARTPREAYLWRMIWQNRIRCYQAELGWVRQLRRGLQETQP